MNAYVKRDIFTGITEYCMLNKNDGYSISIEFKMQDKIDGEKFKNAVKKTMKRYPYLMLKVSKDEKALLFQGIHSYREEIDTINDCFFISIIQGCDEDCYVNAFISELKKLNIPCELISKGKNKAAGLAL